MTSKRHEGISRRGVLLGMGGGIGLAVATGVATLRGEQARVEPSVGPQDAAAPPRAPAPYQRSNAHGNAGPVEPPAAPPALSMLGSDGEVFELATWLSGMPTAVQLIFTRCPSTCPVLGALFAEVGGSLPAETRLLSISVDVAHDGPDKLRAWMQRHGTRQRWHAATPRSERDVEQLFEFLSGSFQGRNRHSLQTFLFDKQGRLAFRTPDLPRASEVTALLTELQRAATG